MGIQNARFKGRVKIRGRPREQASAEIMVMKQREAYQDRQRKRRFFTFLDIIAGLGLLGGILSFYFGRYLNGFLLIGIAVIILGYFLIRRILKRKH